ncbi:MAG: hypothetical protein GY707_04425 [Desulfobacteraceae bacterium]|nr:hypothetical protein [Desulfobacteraceae bacterium]
MRPGTYDYKAAVQYGHQTTRWVFKRIYVKAPIRANLAGPTEISGTRNQDISFNLTASTTAPRDRRHHAQFYDWRKRLIGTEMFRANDYIGHTVTMQHPGEAGRPYYARVCDRDNICSPYASFRIRFRDTGHPRVASFALPPRITMRSGIAEIGFTIRADGNSYDLTGYEIEWRPFLTTGGEFNGRQINYNGTKRLEGMNAATWRPKVRVRNSQNRWSPWFQGPALELVEGGGPALTGSIDAPNRVYRVPTGLRFNYSFSIGGGTIGEYEVRWNRGVLNSGQPNRDNVNHSDRFSQPMPNFNTITLTLRARQHVGRWIDLASKDIEVINDEQTISVAASANPQLASKARDSNIIFRIQLRSIQPAQHIEYAMSHISNDWQRMPMNPDYPITEISVPIENVSPGTYNLRVIGVDADGQRSDSVRIRYVITE